MGDFADAIHTAAIREARASVDDADRMAAMIEVLAKALGFTVSMCAAGDSKLIDKLMIGAEAYAHDEAVEKAPLARLMREMRGRRA